MIVLFGGAKNIYEQNDKHATINPGSQKNEAFKGHYIDVIARKSASSNSDWLIEVETEDSVFESEAKDQWKAYDDTYGVWYLAVPVDQETDTQSLLESYSTSNCTIISWKKKEVGTHAYRGSKVSNEWFKYLIFYESANNSRFKLNVFGMTHYRSWFPVSPSPSNAPRILLERTGFSKNRDETS